MPIKMTLLVLGLLIPKAQTAGNGGSASAPIEDLEARVGSVLNTDGYQNGRWGLLVVDAKDGQPVYERNADQLFGPASVTKLYSTAAALVELGADYRFVTPVVSDGKLDEESGRWNGRLVLVAQGDLSLGGRTGTDGSLLFVDGDHSYAGPTSNTTIVQADPLAGLDHLAREIAASGIQEIRGEIIVDDRLFEVAESTGSGPRRVSPIVVNDNLVDVVVTPGKEPGDLASVKTVPETAYVQFEVQVETAEAGSSRFISVERLSPRRFIVRGRIPAGSGPAFQTFEVEDPASFARALFIECLRKREVHVSASPLADNRVEGLPPLEQVAEWPKLAKYTSPPLSEYLRVILKVSQNLHASTLPLLLASKEGHRTLRKGMERQGEILKGLGVDVGSISFGGGAGGSRSDMVTPRATVTLLQAMAARPDIAIYEAALPILGRDGTLASAVDPDSPARGHVHAKTGTYFVRDSLTGKSILTSKALAGYMETASGRRLIFAFFLNDVPLGNRGDGISTSTSGAGRLLGQLCEVFYDDSPAKSEPEPESDPETESKPEPAQPMVESPEAGAF